MRYIESLSRLEKNGYIGRIKRNPYCSAIKDYGFLLDLRKMILKNSAKI